MTEIFYEKFLGRVFNYRRCLCCGYLERNLKLSQPWQHPVPRLMCHWCYGRCKYGKDCICIRFFVDRLLRYKEGRGKKPIKPDHNPFACGKAKA
jgi:hypothetical protein